MSVDGLVPKIRKRVKLKANCSVMNCKACTPIIKGPGKFVVEGCNGAGSNVREAQACGI